MEVPPTGTPPAAGGRREILATAAALIGLWFVPETWTRHPTFQWDLLGGAAPLDLVSSLSGPACGALLLVLLLLPSPLPLRRWGTALLGAAALALPLLGPAPGVRQPVVLVLPGALALALLGALAASRNRRTAAHLLVLAAPCALLASFLFGMIISDNSFVYIAGIKAPIRIWAASLALAFSLPPIPAPIHAE